MHHQSHTANLTETTLVNALLKVTRFLSSHSTRLLHSLSNLRQRWLDQYSILNSAALVATDLHSVSYPSPLSLLSPDFTTLKTVSDCPQNCLPPATLGIQEFWALYSSGQQFVCLSLFSSSRLFTRQCTRASSCTPRHNSSFVLVLVVPQFGSETTCEGCHKLCFATQAAAATSELLARLLSQYRILQNAGSCP